VTTYHRPVDRYERYAQDALVLGRIGAVLFPQDTRLSVRLPKELADLALAAWNREDSDEPVLLDQETAAQRAARDYAGYLALIGLCIENTAQPDGDDIICDLDAWYIGGALQAAEAMDLLPGHAPARLAAGVVYGTQVSLNARAWPGPGLINVRDYRFVRT
jgi:hypothetical protein